MDGPRLADSVQNHPWVTRNGEDPLLSAEENCATLVDPPTDAEMDNAITGNMVHLLAVMKAVKSFKKLLSRKRPQIMESILGRDSRLVAPPHSIRGGSRSQETHDRRPLDRVLVTEGVHRDVDVDDEGKRIPHGLDKIPRDPSPPTPKKRGKEAPTRADSNDKQQKEKDSHPVHDDDPSRHRSLPGSRSRTFSQEDHAKGHAHDPLTDTLFLDLSSAGEDANPDDHPSHVVSESPPAVEMNIYEQAYQDEMKRILERQGQDASMYLNRRVDHREDLRSHRNILDSSKQAVKDKFTEFANKDHNHGGSQALASLVKQAQAHRAAKSGSRGEDDDNGEEEEEEEAPLTSPFAAVAARKAAERANDSTQAKAASGSASGVPGGFPSTEETPQSSE